MPIKVRHALRQQGSTFCCAPSHRRHGARSAPRTLCCEAQPEVAFSDRWLYLIFSRHKQLHNSNAVPFCIQVLKLTATSIVENAALFDFNLPETDMRLLNGLASLAASTPNSFDPKWSDDVYCLDLRNLRTRRGTASKIAASRQRVRRN